MEKTAKREKNADTPKVKRREQETRVYTPAVKREHTSEELERDLSFDTAMATET